MNRLQIYRMIGDRLHTAGYHPHTPWWSAQTEREYTHPTATRAIYRVGRGGNKSSDCEDWAIVEMFAWADSIPVGERHYLAWVSENTDEAAQRPLKIETKLKALGIACTRSGNTVELSDKPVGVKVFACRVGAVSGFRCIGFIADEEAKWRNADSSANPAREVVASLRAMCVTHPGARERHVSSPLGRLDYHCEQFEEGDNDIQIVGHATSWVANPGAITEEQTHKLERDERIWAREYAAIPQAEETAVLDRAWVEAATTRGYGEMPRSLGPIGLIDFSGGRGDSATWSFAQWGNGEQGPIVNLGDVGGIDGEFYRRLSSSDLVQRIASDLHKPRCGKVYGDAFEAYLLTDEFKRNGLEFESIAWTSQRKTDGVATMRRWFREGTIALPNHPKLVSQLVQLQERILPSGAISYGARTGQHDDYAALVLMASILENEGLLRGSPIRRHTGGRFFERTGYRDNSL